MRTDNWQTWPREEQVTLYTICLLDEMCAEGIIERGKYQATAQGKGNFLDMRQQGWTPTDAEFDRALMAITASSQNCEAEHAHR